MERIQQQLLTFFKAQFNDTNILDEEDEEVDEDDVADLQVFENHDSKEIIDKSIGNVLCRHISSKAIVKNFDEFLKSDYKTLLHRISLDSEYCNKIKFECTKDNYLIAQIPKLNDCIIGDIEIEMNVSDNTTILFEFVNSKSDFMIINMTSLQDKFKDKKMYSSARMVDFNGLRKNKSKNFSKSMKDMYSVYENIAVELRKTGYNKHVIELFEHMKSSTIEYLDYHRSLLEIRIYNAHSIPLDCDMYANVKLKYKQLKLPKLKFLHEISKNRTYFGINKKMLQDVADLY